MTTTEMQRSNRTVFDMSKVSYARLFYRAVCIDNYACAKGIELEVKPDYPTVCGDRIQPDKFYDSITGETELQAARRLGVLDYWMPVWKCVLNNGHTLEFKMGRATELDKAWRAYVFGKTKRKTK